MDQSLAQRSGGSDLDCRVGQFSIAVTIRPKRAAGGFLGPTDVKQVCNIGVNAGILELDAISIRRLDREAPPSGGKLVFADGTECPLVPTGENGKTDFVVDISELLAPLRTTVEFSAYTAQGEPIPLSELVLSRTSEQVHILADNPDPLVERNSGT